MEHIITNDEISKRAYSIYLKSGGDSVANWFQARKELEQELKSLKEELEAQEQHDRIVKDILWPKD